jgi:shikimate dehydrogenase
MLLGLLGDERVFLSPSPDMHAQALAACGIHGHYLPLRAKESDLHSILPALWKLGFHGLNVTAPLKEAALAHSQGCTPECRAIGAANTLARVIAEGVPQRDQDWLADNTDAPGFAEAYLQGIEPSPALVLGAGGAARAVLHALKAKGFHAYILNRTYSRAKTLAAFFRADVFPKGSEPPSLGPFPLVVNASSVSTEAELGDFLPMLRVAKGGLVVDINYGRKPNLFENLAKKAGASFSDGRSMLAHQARLSFIRWTGRDDIGIEPFVKGLG